MTTRKRMGRRRAMAALLAASMLLAVLPGTARAAAWLNTTNVSSASNWSWPALAQTIEVFGGAIETVTLTLHRKSTDTGNYRVEIRQVKSVVEPGDEASPTGNQYPSTGIVLAAETLPATALSTNSGAPTDVTVDFTHPAVLAGQTSLAVVLIRGTNTGIAWHASAPGGVDEYDAGEGYFCTLSNCWDDQSPSGAVDFRLDISGTSPLAGQKPRASVVAPLGPTRLLAFDYHVYFDKGVTGLSAADFSKTGSAENCTLGAPVNLDSGTKWRVRVSGCSAGSLRLTLKANTVGVNLEPSVTGPAVDTPSPSGLRIDRTKPKVGAPRATPTFGPVDSGKLPIKLTWDQGTDAGGAGVRYYEIWRSINGGATWTLRGGSQPLFAVDAPEAVDTVIYRIRAVDWAGNKSAFAEGPVLRPRIVNQTSSNVRFSTGWTTLSDAAFTGGSARQSDVSGAAARYTFTGRGVGVIMTTDPSLGVIKVYIDGDLKKTVDMSTLMKGDQLVVYGRRLSYGEHVIRIVSSSGARPNVILDGFVRL